MVVAMLATATTARTAATGGRLGGRVDWSEGLTGQGWRLGGGVDVASGRGSGRSAYVDNKPAAAKAPLLPI